MGNLNHGGTKDTEENRGLGSLFLKKLLLEVIAWQPVPQPGRSAVALAEAEGLPESSRGSSASEPPGSRPETDCTPGRGARATQPETIHLRRSFFLNQHPQGVPALCLFAFVLDFPRCRLPLWSSGSPVSARPPVRPVKVSQSQSSLCLSRSTPEPRTETRNPRPQSRSRSVKPSQAFQDPEPLRSPPPAGTSQTRFKPGSNQAKSPQKQG
jgi:hypothetical protein